LNYLQKNIPNLDLSEYITFNSLRNYGLLDNNCVTEQIYVHAKLIIVDDRITLIGSANINDRSLEGDRDSEIAILLRDNITVESQMGGQPYRAGKFSHTLRTALWREHLGLDSNDMQVMDPIIDSVYRSLWLETARTNTRIFSEVFPVLPTNDKAKLSSVCERVHKVDAQSTIALNTVRGHLVNYALDFLKEENLNLSGLMSAFVSDVTFT